jgi:hypothetical protein
VTAPKSSNDTVERRLLKMKALQHETVKEPVLRIDDRGKRAAARTIAGNDKKEGNFTGNPWVSEMYMSQAAGGVRTKDVIITRGGF